MKVTLRKFLDITGANFAYSTSLYVDEYDELFAEWYPKLKIKEITGISDLEPYMDYEIYDFIIKSTLTKSICQNIYLRKM